MPFRYVLALSVLCSILPAQSFDIRVLGGRIPAAQTTVQYSLNSPLRARNSWIVSRADDETLRIPTGFDDGSVAQTIQALIVVPGCESAAVDAKLSQTGEGSFDFKCKRLPYTFLSGLFLKPELIAKIIDRGLDIEADYLPHWIKTLPRIRIPVAHTTLASDGHFSIAIPDFTTDPIARQTGTLQIWARDRATGADFAQLRTAQLRTKDADRTGNLPLGPINPAPIEFVPCLVMGKSPDIDIHTHFAIRGASYSCNTP